MHFCILFVQRTASIDRAPSLALTRRFAASREVMFLSCVDSPPTTDHVAKVTRSVWAYTAVKACHRFLALTALFRGIGVCSGTVSDVKVVLARAKLRAGLCQDRRGMCRHRRGLIWRRTHGYIIVQEALEGRERTGGDELEDCVLAGVWPGLSPLTSIRASADANVVPVLAGDFTSKE
jgi:hypothetical protein